MGKKRKETELLPCAFNHPDCYSYSHGICRLLGDMDFHGKDCSFYATKDQVREIAELKMPDLNAASVEAAMSMIAGTARSMGIVVGD